MALAYLPPVGSPSTYVGGFVGYHFAVGGDEANPTFRIGGGLRGGGPLGGSSVPLEGFFRTQLMASFGPWRPEGGPEIGVSGFSQSKARRTTPQTALQSDNNQPGPGYVAFDAAPIRFALGSYTLTALEMQVGTTFPPFGRSVRLQLGLVEVGLSL